MTQKSIVVAIYARVSTDRQELEQQIEACNRFCAFKNLTVKEVFSDIGSGKDFFRRPNFMELLKQLRERHYDGIVTFRFDRLGRNSREVVLFFDEMEAKGIEIYSVNERLDTSTAIGRAMRDIIVRLSQLERENISEATKQRLDALKAQGKILGRPKGSKDTKHRRKSGYYLRWSKGKK